MWGAQIHTWMISVDKVLLHPYRSQGDKGRSTALVAGQGVFLLLSNYFWVAIPIFRDHVIVDPAQLVAIRWLYFIYLGQ